MSTTTDDSVTSYADDTARIVRGNSCKEIDQKMNISLEVVMTWLLFEKGKN